jgi:REP element-mobilizing transposase RayT
MPQSLAHLGLHVVFSTKDRKRWLDTPGLREDLNAYVAGILRGHDSPAVAVGGTEDHLHLLCHLSRKLAVADLVKVTKRAATLWVRERSPEYRGFQWQAGYGAFSVSASNMDRVRAYILDQEAHHRKMGFQDEFRRLLKKHKVEYDERYVWD